MIETRGGREGSSEYSDLMNYTEADPATEMIFRWDGEICTKCKRDQRLAWSIKDNKWNAVISESNFNRNRVFCLECFLALADHKGIEIKVSDFLFFAWVGMNIKGDTLIDETHCITKNQTLGG